MAKVRAIPAKVKKAEKAEMVAMKKGKSHSQAEREEHRVLLRDKVQQREYPAPKPKRKPR